MTILELNIHPATADTCSQAHVSIDGKEYLVLGSTNGSVTVLTGAWITNRRALGRTYWSAAALLAAYKRHGAILLEYAERMVTWKGDVR